MRYIGILFSIISAAFGLFIYFMLIPTINDADNHMLRFIFLSPLIWFSVGIINMYIMRIFGSGFRNKLLTYIPEKNDVIVNRIATSWIIDLIGISITIWGWSYLPWFLTIIFSWDPLNPTITQAIVLLLTLLPIFYYLLRMYFHLHFHLGNVPILVLSTDGLRTDNATYSWKDIGGINRPNREYLEVNLKKRAMEKYNTQFPNIVSLHQEEISEHIFDLFKKMESLKKKAS